MNLPAIFQSDVGSGW